MGLLEITGFYEKQLMKLKLLSLSFLLLMPLVSSTLFSDSPWLEKKYVDERMKELASVKGRRPFPVACDLDKGTLYQGYDFLDYCEEGERTQGALWNSFGGKTQ
jgi:hypothetical protein